MSDAAFIDTHAHYFDKKFDTLPGGAAGLLTDPAFLSCVRGVINIGTNLENSRTAVAQAAGYPFMVAAVGIHPEDCQAYDETTVPLDPDTELSRLENWLSDPVARRRDKIVALGEIGLDNHWQPVDRERQMAFFEGQLSLAEKLDLPVIVHDREAHGDCFEAVLRHPAVRGVFHGYSGSGEMARQLIHRGWYIAFGGSVTFKNAQRVREVAASVPPERLLLETDCPYMAPVPYRGQVNHSGYLPAVAHVVADLHGLSVAELADVTTRGADQLFHLRQFLQDL
jgi:TatD DNase family protein